MTHFDVLLKVALLGDDGVGKATILKSFAEEPFVGGKLKDTCISLYMFEAMKRNLCD